MVVTITRDRVAAVRQAIRDMVTQRVLVGIPEDAAARADDDSASNALIGYVLETGAPERNLPPRPFLVPGVENAREQVIKILYRGGVRTLEGDAGAMQAALTSAGLIASASVKDKMDTGPFAPLADATLEGRVRRGGGAQIGAKEELARRRRGEPPGTDLAQPLIDTGDLQNSITYVVRKVR